MCGPDVEMKAETQQKNPTEMSFQELLELQRAAWSRSKQLKHTKHESIASELVVKDTKEQTLKIDF